MSLDADRLNPMALRIKELEAENERLRAGAKLSVEKGHHDTCYCALCPYDQGAICGCGYDLLRAALEEK